jgi:hypothetical protein
MWAHAKREFKRVGRKKTHMYGYLATFMLKRKLAAEPGNSFIGFVDLANECALRKLPVGDHHLNIPAGEATYIPEELPVSLPPPKRSKRERFLPYWANDLNSSLS